jgi:signal transduction histidine kinase
VTAFQDISALKEFERQKDEFLQAVSHDLKNPLATIKGYAQYLRRRLPDRSEQFMPMIERIEAAASRAVSLLDELLDLTRLQMGRPLELMRHQTDLVALVRRLSEQHQATAERHHIRVESSVAELVGEWDEVRIERVLSNLLANAIKYSPGGGPVTVETMLESETGTWAVLRVRDQGIGIPAADLPRLFERSAADPGYGTRSGEREADRGAARGHGHSREYRGAGLDFHRPAAAGCVGC